jgi:hypothetical protein
MAYDRQGARTLAGQIDKATRASFRILPLFVSYQIGYWLNAKRGEINRTSRRVRVDCAMSVMQLIVPPCTGAKPHLALVNVRSRPLRAPYTGVTDEDARKGKPSAPKNAEQSERPRSLRTRDFRPDSSR